MRDDVAHSHTEIDHRSPQHDETASLRADLQPALEMIMEALHYDGLLAPGQQWTIPLGSDCGFAARVIIQLDRLGSCASDEDPVYYPAPAPNGE